MFEKYGPDEKNAINQIVYFQFYNIIGKFDSNWFTSYRYKEFWKRCALDFILYQFISESMTNIKKKSLKKTVLYFDFMFGSQILLEKIEKVENLRYIIPPPPTLLPLQPIFKASTVRSIFKWSQIYY